MSSAATGGRAQVLAQIRKSLGRSSDAVAPLPLLPASKLRPAFSGPLVERFVAKMEEKAATVQRLTSLAEVGEAVLRRLAPADAAAAASNSARPTVRVSGALASLAWPSQLGVLHGAAERDDETSVTPCFAAVAESGSIVTLSGRDTPSTLNFVPATHIVVVHASQVVAHLEDVWALWRAGGLAMPRTINLISGPSRTADIEQTIQLGAHGPRRLHILLVAG